MISIIISNENSEKLINNRTLAEILKDFQPDEKEYSFIKNIFQKANNQEDIIKELILIKSKTTPASLLLVIKALGKISISEALPILDEVLKD